MTNPFLPHLLSGVARDANGDLLTNTSLTIINLNTKDTITATTNGSGQYLVDLANFANGWHDGDLVRSYVTTAPTIEHYVSIDGGYTWHQMDISTVYNVACNSTRVKIDTTLYPAGRTDLRVDLS